jgi:hypothetical protein
MNKKKLSKIEWVLFFVFVVLFFLTRVPRLSTDTINPDGVNWHYRSQQFINGIKYRQLERTYQHYHPGVTLMWVTGVPVEISKHIIGNKQYDHMNFLFFDFVAKYSLVYVQIILSLFIIFLLSKVLDFKTGFFIVSLFTFEPFFVGNSRLYHLDALFTLLVFVALIYSYLLFKTEKYVYAIIAGLFWALAFLTKSVGIGGIPFVLAYGLLNAFLTKKWKKSLRFLGVCVLSFVFFTFLFFPALWVHPAQYLGNIFSESERVGIRKGHGQIIMGEYTRNGGIVFYPLVLLLKFTPFLLLGVFSFFWDLRKRKLDSFTIFLTIFYVGYLLAMMYPTKKIDRYMVLMFPYLAYLAFFGFKFLLDKFGNRFGYFLISLFGVVFVVGPLFSFFPYYFTYTSPVFGSTENASNIITQKPFGVGMYDLRNFIFERYGMFPTLGFVDTKPMNAIYPDSKVFDIRINGSRKFDIAVLGPNESFPEDFVGHFKKDSSFYINGLEYWRIYVKEVEKD